jgi:hypothetical protein
VLVEEELHDLTGPLFRKGKIRIPREFWWRNSLKMPSWKIEK